MKLRIFVLLVVVAVFAMGVTYTIDSVKAPTSSGITIQNNSAGTVATFGASGGVDMSMTNGSTLTAETIQEVDATGLQLGGTTDYTQVEPDGTLVFKGAATVFDDLMIPGLAVRTQGTADPNLDVYLGKTRQFAFVHGATNEVFISVQMPHCWAEATTIFPHVHWAPSTNGAGNVEWGMEYTWANISGTYAAPSGRVVGIGATGTTAHKHNLTSFPTAGTGISGSGKTFSSILVIRLYRNGASGSDTYADKAFLLGFDIHIEMDTFGSRQEFIK